MWTAKKGPQERPVFLHYSISGQPVTLLALTWSFVKKHLLVCVPYIILQVSPFAEPMFFNLPFQRIWCQRALYFVVYAIKHFNTERVQSKASVTGINILRNRIFLPVAKDLWVSTIIVILHNQSVYIRKFQK